jgi:ATP-binding cassette subfamily B (MDR/TAP) protein 1
MMGGSSLGQAAPSLDAIARGRGAATQIYRVIDRQPTIDARAAGGEQPPSCSGELLLDAVSFAYAARPDAPVFCGLSLRIPAGRMTALVGESGSGKSTVIQLIARFYDPDAGAVRLDGRDLRTLNVAWLRRQVGLVSQEPVLFATSVADNLRYGCPEASQAQLEAACRAANAHAFIVAVRLLPACHLCVDASAHARASCHAQQMSEGYSTYVGERGAQMSGGQKQRIAIARAVLRNPRVLLLVRSAACVSILRGANAADTQALTRRMRQRQRWTTSPSAWCRRRWTTSAPRAGAPPSRWRTG